MKRSRIRAGAVLATLLVAFVSCSAVRSDAAEGFTNCAAAFPGSDIGRAPKRMHAAGSADSDSVALCQHEGETAFFQPTLTAACQTE